MPNKCDHGRCEYKYCPYCGALVGDVGTPQALAAYLRTRQSCSLIDAEKDRAEAASQPPPDKNSCEFRLRTLAAKRARCKEKTAAKFAAWAEWVEGQIAETPAKRPIEQKGMNQPVNKPQPLHEDCNGPVHAGSPKIPAPINREPTPTPAPPPKKY